MNLTPKKIYEKITLANSTPTEEELNSMKGTRWHHKYHGTVPDKTEAFKTFKNFFMDSATHQPVDAYGLASFISDKLEDKFGLHYADFTFDDTDPSKFEIVKQTAMDLISKANAPVADKKIIAKLVNDADDVYILMMRLNSKAEKPN